MSTPVHHIHMGGGAKTPPWSSSPSLRHWPQLLKPSCVATPAPNVPLLPHCSLQLLRSPCLPSLRTHHLPTIISPLGHEGGPKHSSSSTPSQGPSSTHLCSCSALTTAGKTHSVHLLPDGMVMSFYLFVALDSVCRGHRPPRLIHQVQVLFGHPVCCQCPSGRTGERVWRDDAGPGRLEGESKQQLLGCLMQLHQSKGASRVQKHSGICQGRRAPD
jgi:hypothetical protein